MDNEMENDKVEENQKGEEKAIGIPLDKRGEKGSEKCRQRGVQLNRRQIQVHLEGNQENGTQSTFPTNRMEHGYSPFDKVVGNKGATYSISN